MTERTKRRPAISEDRRMLDEMLEMASTLDTHGLITKPDMVQMRGL